MQIPDSVFFNKEQCDSIRDIVEKSPCSFHEALNLINISTDLDRDVHIIKKLRCSGISEKQTRTILTVINT